MKIKITLNATDQRSTPLTRVHFGVFWDKSLNEKLGLLAAVLLADQPWSLRSPLTLAWTLQPSMWPGPAWHVWGQTDGPTRLTSYTWPPSELLLGNPAPLPSEWGHQLRAERGPQKTPVLISSCSDVSM